MPDSFGDLDGGMRAGVKFQEVGLDAVAEDDAPFRHVGFNLQRMIGRDAPKHQGRGRRFAREWLPHREKEVLGIPRETRCRNGGGVSGP